MRRDTTLGILVGVGIVAALPADAADITIDFLRNTTSQETITGDPASGAFYSQFGFGTNFGSPGAYTTYGNAAAFAAGASSGTTPTLAGGGTAGTYGVVIGGELYQRTTLPLGQNNWPASNLVGAWNLSTGALDFTKAIPNMNGVDGPDTFNWGGFSGLNVMRDQTGMYVIGHGAGGWVADKVDQNLNVLSTVNIPGSGFGYGFTIGGKLFLGDSYNSNHISDEVDLTTGQLTSVDFTLVGGSQSPYWDDMYYDPGLDTLYLDNAGNQNIFTVADASQAFGVSLAVPEPSSLALLGVGLAGLVIARRRKAA